MRTEVKSPNKIVDTPSDKPQGDRVEHGNLDRPGAQAHPRAAVRRGTGDWTPYLAQPAWRLH